MFTRSYFCDSLFPPSYWPKVVPAAAGGRGGFRGAGWAAHYLQQAVQRGRAQRLHREALENLAVKVLANQVRYREEKALADATAQFQAVTLLLAEV